MSVGIQAVRGMHDVLPSEIPLWRHLESIVSTVLESYGYREIRMPTLEKTELFLRSIGEVTDIVEKEMYTFADRNGENLTLRPEGTAGCVRACLEHGLIQNTQTRLWYHGPMFRHERPQKGRYRQFYQIGVEAFGMADADLDAELILLSRRLWQRLGLLPHVTLEINTLGTVESRRVFRDKLVDYFKAHVDQLDEDSQRRLQTNPLRILDSKNPQVKALVENAPKLLEYVDEASLAHYQNLKRLIADAGVAYAENPYLVRGLDYYSRTVFEWTTTKLGAQATVCAGGRYDGLVEMLGGSATSACGFAMGVERLVGLMQEVGLTQEPSTPHVFIVSAGVHAQTVGLQFAESLRDAKDGIRIVTNCGGGSFKAQMKRADKSGAKWAVLIGDDEAAKGVVTLKPLREDGAQTTLSASQAVEFIVKQV